MGKPTGNDIKEKKITLPLIYTINKADKPLRKELIYILRNQNKNPEKVQYVIKKVIETGGIEYATKVMNAYKQEALAILHEFEDNDARKGLEELVSFTTGRNY